MKDVQLVEAATNFERSLWEGNIIRVVTNKQLRLDSVPLFELSSQKPSPWYVDFKDPQNISAQEAAAKLQAQYAFLMFQEELAKGEIDWVMGIPNSGNIIATEFAHLSNLPVNCMTKIDKGDLNPTVKLKFPVKRGDNFLAFENALTSGGGIFRHLVPLADIEVHPLGVIIGVDRQEDRALKNVKKHPLLNPETVVAVTNRDRLMITGLQEGYISHDQFSFIQSFYRQP